MRTLHLISLRFFLILITLSVSIGAEDSRKIAHLLNRLSFGPKTGDIELVEKQGIMPYIQQQLTPESIPLPNAMSDKLKQFPSATLSCRDLYLKANKKPLEAQKIFLESTEMRLLYSTENPRQLYELMVEFWFNHFNIAATKGFDRFWVGAFERDAIRPHAMGNFLDLLLATAQHPAMLFYLDNWQNKIPKKNKKEGINENYAREVMELHTLGVDGGYTQADVIALAHILTGWGFSLIDHPRKPIGTFYFDPAAHDPSPQLFLGKSFSGQGEQEGIKALTLLANHASTAKHIAFKLAQYFVSDQPPQELVRMLATRFVSSGGDITTILKTLFTHPAFWDSSVYNIKFKTPYRYTISAIRLSGVDVYNYRPLVNQLRLQGMPVYGHETPDGYKNIKEAWLNPDSLLTRISFASALAKGQLPLNAKAGSEKFKKTPVDPITIEKIATSYFSRSIVDIVLKAPKVDHAGMFLANPEMMRY